jgi:hypothetical protein
VTGQMTMQDWLTYDEAAERLGVSAEAIRCRAKRQRWRRTRGNDGRARIQLPDDLHDLVTDRATPGRPGELTGQMTAPVTTPVDERLIAALEAHIQTLQAELAHARAETESVRAELTAEREAAREAAAAYRRLTDELIELRKASASPPLPPRPSAPRPRPAPPASDTGDGRRYPVPFRLYPAGRI